MTNCREALWHLRRGIRDAKYRYPANPGVFTGSLALAWMCYGQAIAANERRCDTVHRVIWNVQHRYSCALDEWYLKRRLAAEDTPEWRWCAA